MKLAPLQWLVCVVALTGALWGFGALQAVNATALAKSGSLSTRSAQDPADPGRIIFRYIDFDGGLHQFECHVDPNFSRFERDSFGYPLDEETALRALDQLMKAEVEKAIGPLAPYVVTKVTHAAASSPPHGIHWEPYVELLPRAASDLPAALRMKAPRTLAGALDHVPIKALTTLLYSAYLADHGFLNKKNGGQTVAGQAEHEIDFKGVADRARPWLKDCYDRFQQESGLGEFEDLVRLLPSVFQSLPLDLKKLAPEEDEGLYKKGLWVPTQLLLRGQADCDSNATAFCALWQSSWPTTLLLPVAIPDEISSDFPLEAQSVRWHALVGINVYPNPDQEVYSDGLRNFLLCEVAMPDGFGLFRCGTTYLARLPSETSGICMVGDCTSDF